MNQDELKNLLINASGKIDSNTAADKDNDLVHYWLSQALFYWVEDTIIKWAIDIGHRGDIMKGDIINGG